MVVWRPRITEPTINRGGGEGPCSRGKHHGFCWTERVFVDSPVLSQTVALSLISPSWYFVEFADGATNYTLPPDWHDSVNGYTALAARNKGPKISTSYRTMPSHSPSPSPSPHSPWPGQYGLFSSVSPDGSSAGYTPYASNPYPAPMFTSPPQPVYPSPPPPMFTGTPMPIYNITNIYNQQPQTLASEQKNNDDMVQLLGGVLKVAGAVLVPMLTGTGSGGF
jgi:hypothetical protein